MKDEQRVTVRPTALVDAVESTGPAQAFVSWKHLSREALPALGTTGADDATTVLGGHPHEETVGASALALLAAVAEGQGLLSHDGELLDERDRVNGPGDHVPCGRNLMKI
jgi:hypothetical protein